ncbi:hypothetical protein R3P38DRAFT_2446066, partial [Favolaschia claudopus]
LPKAATDKLMQLQDRISALEGIVYDLRDKLEEKKEEIRDLDNENHQLWSRINEVEDLHESMRQKLERVVDFIDNSDLERIDSKQKQITTSTKVKGERDNIFNV